jgi:outer membrane protein
MKRALKRTLTAAAIAVAAFAFGGSASIAQTAAAPAAPAAAASFKIGFIDLDRIMKEHPTMVKWTAELEQIKVQREAEIEKTIKDKFGVTNQTELSEEQRTQIQRIIIQENQRFTQEMEPKHKEKLAQVESDVRELGAVVATEKKLDLVLDRVVVIYGGGDVTDAILDKIKAKYK